MNLDSQSVTTHNGMESQSRCSYKYLLLQVWCALLTVSIVVMARLLASIELKSTEDRVSTLKPDNVPPTVNSIVAPLKAVGTSYIQLKHVQNSWQEDHRCPFCSLVLHNNSIHCKKNGLYFIYAQVTFGKQPIKNQSKSVILKRNASVGKEQRKLVEGNFPNTTESSVWVAKIVKLVEGDSFSLDILDNVRWDNTFWGAYQLH
ncbi:lymphotoxin-alpha [Brachyistius frenatus]|uniref:lymphotoxin-alpha n=1 Tax=Brachyistius frenatus TaxID=100188 RepID=UPI0037E74E51